MPFIETNAKEIHCKLVYCGSDQMGKKSSILHIKDRFKADKKELLSLPFKKEVLMLVLSAGKLFDFEVFFHIYNLNNESKENNKVLLRGADGIVFIAGSAAKDRPKNIQSFQEIEDFFEGVPGKGLVKFPLVFQYNKRDLENPIPIRHLRIDLNKYNNKDFESSVLRGQMILEPLKHVCKLILNHLKSA